MSSEIPSGPRSLPPRKQSAATSAASDVSGESNVSGTNDSGNASGASTASAAKRAATTHSAKSATVTNPQPSQVATSDDALAPAGRPAGSRSSAVILSDADIRRTIDRIAHEILESVGDSEVLLLGIPRRGTPLARRLAERMRIFAPGDYPVGSLDITLYRDDLRTRPPRALAETNIPVTGIDGLTVVLVDDVLYSGRTIRAAMDALRDHGRPAAIRLAVLVDRGHRQLPIRADFVGKNIPTAFDDDVAVHLVEIDGIDAVTVERAQ